MQKDEEVGKVAQATPVLICQSYGLCLDLVYVFSWLSITSCHVRLPSIAKGLELFMATIVDEMSKVTIERGGKRVEVWHL